MAYKVTCSFNGKRIAYGKQVVNRKAAEKAAEEMAEAIRSSGFKGEIEKYAYPVGGPSTMNVKDIAWDFRTWRASMTDETEYRVWFYDKKKDIPYSATISFYYRDNGKKDYCAVIQGRVAEEIRGWWMTRTFLHTTGTFTNPETVISNVGKVIAKLGGPMTYISMDEYGDWSDRHPIQKKRRVGSDWGIYVIGRKTSEKGWLDMVYGSILERNAYASRFNSREEAQKQADKLSQRAPEYKFEVRQLGKLDQ